MGKLTGNQWLIDELSKISKKNYVKTYFTCAQLRLKGTKEVVQVILPVDVYEVGGTGFEIMPIVVLTKNCPWDMDKVLVTIRSDNTTIMDENLGAIVVEDAELHGYLTQLDDDKY